MKTLGLYIHIPFCRSKCLYCDFCSFARPDLSTLSQYTDTLCADLTARSADCADYTVDTVFLGGGTPTLLSEELTERILNTVATQFHLSDDCEISAECNPGTVNPEKLKRLRKAGLNRLSIGLQSAHQNELRALGRIHSFEDFKTAFLSARQAGFENIGVDLMMGIPQQTPESYLQTLERVLALSPDHLSSYGLTVEADTPFGKMGDRLILPDEDACLRMEAEGAHLLRSKGFTRYEISNFARTGFECRHNLKYWNCDEYLGFGPAAHSDFGGIRFGNSRNLAAYLNGENVMEEAHAPDLNERINEYVMLRMRLAEGVRAKELSTRFQTDFLTTFYPRMKPFAENGLLRLDEDGAAFTDRGFSVSNTVLAEILEF